MNAERIYINILLSSNIFIAMRDNIRNFVKNNKKIATSENGDVECKSNVQSLVCGNKIPKVSSEAIQLSIKNIGLHMCMIYSVKKIP